MASPKRKGMGAGGGCAAKSVKLDESGTAPKQTADGLGKQVAQYCSSVQMHVVRRPVSARMSIAYVPPAAGGPKSERRSARMSTGLVSRYDSQRAAAAAAAVANTT